MAKQSETTGQTDRWQNKVRLQDRQTDGKTKCDYRTDRWQNEVISGSGDLTFRPVKNLLSNSQAGL